jgi:hypothetical protein
MGDIYDLDTFTLTTSGGYTAQNVPVAGTSTTKKGLVERRIRLVIDEKGEECQSSANIHLEGNITVTTEDIITLDGARRVIIAVEHPKDFTRQTTVIYLR